MNIEEVNGVMDLAVEELSMAQILFDAGKYRGSITHSYYAMFDAAKGTLSRIMQDDVAPYECEEPLDMDYIKSKIKRADSYEKQDTFTVRNYHMDFNRHMNNAWHLRIAEEYVTDHMKVKKVRIEYKMQAVLGDCMIAYVARESGRTVVELRNSEDELFSITEFDY